MHIWYLLLMPTFIYMHLHSRKTFSQITLTGRTYSSNVLHYSAPSNSAHVPKIGSMSKMRSRVISFCCLCKLAVKQLKIAAPQGIWNVISVCFCFACRRHIFRVQTDWIGRLLIVSSLPLSAGMTVKFWIAQWTTFEEMWFVNGVRQRLPSQVLELREQFVKAYWKVVQFLGWMPSINQANSLCIVVSIEVRGIFYE